MAWYPHKYQHEESAVMQPVKNDTPPPPPEIKRKLEFWPLQKIGVLILAVIPILAFLGLFDSQYKSKSLQLPNLTLTLSYPQRLRFSEDGVLNIHLTNSASAPQSVTLTMNDKYVETMGELHARPMLAMPGPEFTIYDGIVAANETLNIQLNYKAAAYGKIRGGLKLQQPETTNQTLQFTTFIYP